MELDWKDALKGLQVPQVEDIDSKNSTTDKCIQVCENEVQKEPLKILTDRKARKGKTATIVEGFLCNDEILKEIAKELKCKIGTGGSARSGEILLQGDWKSKVAEELTKKGYKVKIC